MAMLHANPALAGYYVCSGRSHLPVAGDAPSLHFPTKNLIAPAPQSHPN
ncbi:MAG: hypothetical protein ABI876_11935 [Bacteroidota bacterium]